MIKTKRKSDETILIYPYKNANKLELQEKCIKLALKTASLQTNTLNNLVDDFNFLLVASLHLNDDTLTLLIDRFDQGQLKNGNQMVPIAPLSDSIYIPSKLFNDSIDHDPSYLKTFYFNSVQLLSNYISKLCNNIDLSNVLSICSTIFYTPNTINECSYNTVSSTYQIKTSFDLVTLGNCFDAHRLQPLPIVETSLLKTLQTVPNFYLKPKTGYCAQYKNDTLVLIMDSEPKLDKLPLVGIWLSGVTSVNHPLTWTACLRFKFSSLIKNKAEQFQNQFIVILFGSITKQPEFYLCNSVDSKLDFILLSGHSKLLVNKSNNDNRCMTVDLNKLKLEDNSFKYQLFQNSLEMIFKPQQQFLNPTGIILDHHKTLNNNKDMHQLTNRASFDCYTKTSDYSSASIEFEDIKPRSTIPILNQEYQKYLTNKNKNQLISSSASCLSTSQSNASNFAVGSYHSVSDISVLSDTDNSDLNDFINFKKAKNNKKLLHQSPNEHDDNFEFIRPKDPPPLPYSNMNSDSIIKNYDQNLYNNSATSCTNDESFSESISKSVMFGIPRPAIPKPTIGSSSVGVDFHPANLDSPFVDITLNNCDDMSLYQPTSQPEVPKSILKKNSPSVSQTIKQHQVLTEQMKKLPPNIQTQCDIQELNRLPYINQPKNSHTFQPIQLSKSNEFHFNNPSTSNLPQQNCHLLANSSDFSTTKFNEKLYSNTNYNCSFPQNVYNQIPNQNSNNLLNLSASKQINSNTKNFLNDNSTMNTSASTINQSNLPADYCNQNDKVLNSSVSSSYSTHSSSSSSSAASLAASSNQQLITNQHLFANIQAQNSINKKMNDLNINLNQNYNNIVLEPKLVSNNDFNMMSFENNQMKFYNSINDSSANMNQLHNFINKLDISNKSNNSTNNFKTNNLIQMNEQVVDIYSSSNSLKSIQSEHIQQKQINPPNDFLKTKLNTDIIVNKNVIVKHGSDNDNEDDDDEELNNSCENVFSATLKDLKEKNANWDLQDKLQNNASIMGNQIFKTNDQENTLTNNSSVILPKFQYMSLFLDDLDTISSTNTSINTKALAAKYLAKTSSSNQNLNFGSSSLSTSIPNLNSCIMNSEMSTILPSTEAQKLFQIYQSNSIILPNDNINSIGSNDFINKQTKNNNEFVFKQTSNLASNNYNNCKKSVSSNSSNDSNESDSKKSENTDNSDKEFDKKQEDEYSSDEDIWLFGKPSSSSSKRENNSIGDKKSKNIKKSKNKPKKIKDFSDQDTDSDKDVTTVLDIEKLKRLPKLL